MQNEMPLIDLYHVSQSKAQALKLSSTLILAKYRNIAGGSSRDGQCHAQFCFDSMSVSPTHSNKRNKHLLSTSLRRLQKFIFYME